MIPLDFQPVIGTQVAARYVDEGDAFVDRVTVSTVGTGEWIIVDGTPVELTATGTLYGPFDEQPTEADTAPDGAPVAGTETLTLTGTGEYLSAGTVTATESGGNANPAPGFRGGRRRRRPFGSALTSLDAQAPPGRALVLVSAASSERRPIMAAPRTLTTTRCREVSS